MQPMLHTILKDIIKPYKKFLHLNEDAMLV